MSGAEKPKKIKKKKKAEQGVGVTHPTLDDFLCELEEQAVCVESNGKVYVVRFSVTSSPILNRRLKLSRACIFSMEDK
jgi:hypothetical protein